MRKRLLVVLTLVLFISLSIVTIANATLIDSSVIVRADFNLTGQKPDPPYDLLAVHLEFNSAIDGGQPGEGYTMSLFNGGNNLIQSHSFTLPTLPPGVTVWDGVGDFFDFGSKIYTPSIGDYIILDNIVGSFDLKSIPIWGRAGLSANGYEAYWTPDGIYGELTISPVPEPATMLLLASGLVGLAGLRRKFKRN